MRIARRVLLTRAVSGIRLEPLSLTLAPIAEEDGRLRAR